MPGQNTIPGAHLLLREDKDGRSTSDQPLGERREDTLSGLLELVALASVEVKDERQPPGQGEGERYVPQ